MAGAAAATTSIALLANVACFQPRHTPAELPAVEAGPAPQPQKDNALRVAITPSLTDYFVYRGRPRGFEYDLAARFARILDRRLALVIITNHQGARAQLQAGTVDLWIPGEPLNNPPADAEAITPYAHTDTVVVAAKGDRPLLVASRSGSPASADLTRWCTPPCTQSPRPGGNDWSLLTSLLKDAAPGRAVAVNRRHGHAFTLIHTNFEVVHGMGVARPVRWWVRKQRGDLAEAARNYFAQGAKGRYRAALTARYFDNPFQMRMRSRPWVRSDLAKRISRWDDALKSAGRRYGLDWRLLAAVMMIESAQNPTATSQAGARGLFQLMPKTAKALGVDDPNNPDQAIPAAAAYLRFLQRRFAAASTPYDQRMMTLAAYNVGVAHIDDARSLTDQLSLDRNSWDDGVSLTLPLLARPAFAKQASHGRCQGVVATRYAEQVSDLYEQYSQLLPEVLMDRDGGPETP
jgi:membrane-bound lytic murein transglycosylase F